MTDERQPWEQRERLQALHARAKDALWSFEDLMTVVVAAQVEIRKLRARVAELEGERNVY